MVYLQSDLVSASVQLKKLGVGEVGGWGMREGEEEGRGREG